MGKLLRRYWAPFLLAEEIPEPDCPPVRVKLMGERLIAFRDSKGRIGLIDEFCAHRGVSLWFGESEDCGIRCHYHGWKYDVTGQCVDLPSEPEESGLPQEHQIEILSLHREGRDRLGLYGAAGTAAAAAGAGMDRREARAALRLQALAGMQLPAGDGRRHRIPATCRGCTAASSTRIRCSRAARGNEYNIRDRMPLFEVEEFPGGLLIGARRNADAGKYYWRITPWIMPWYTIIPPRAGHPLGAHAWVPIDDETCWAWSINYHPKRALTKAEVSAMQDGEGIHVKYVPGTFIPLANKSNNYLMDRDAQRHGHSATGVDGIAMQDASIQESMGAIQDRTMEHLCATDAGIVMTRKLMLRAAKAAAEGKPVPATEPQAQRVRSVAIELDQGVSFSKAPSTGSMPNSAPIRCRL